jgi:hypothetical protein
MPAGVQVQVWIVSWLSIAGAGCGLICIGTGEERA